MPKQTQSQSGHRLERTPWGEFSRAFPIWCTIEAENDKLARAPTNFERRRIERNITRLTRLVVAREGASKWARWKPIIDKCREYFSCYGKPKNIHEMYMWMQSEGVLSGLNEHGKQWFVGETTFRTILHEVFDIYGQNKRYAGKKPGKTRAKQARIRH